MSLIDQAYGTLLGVAIGDALGMPSELWSRQKVKRHFGEITDFLPGPDGHFVAEGMEAGEITDDTNQALKIAEAIIQSEGEIKARKIADNLLEWVEENNVLENNLLGPSSRRALQRIKDGEPVEETGEFGNTNGAAMRISPIGIVKSVQDFESLIDAVEEVCLPTHHTDVAIAGASGVAAAISTAMISDSLDRVFNNAIKAMRMGYRRGREVFDPSVIERTYLAFQIIDDSSLQEEALEKLYNVVGAGVSVPESVPTSLAIVKLAQGDPIEAAFTAANLGGDCDTIGAIAGGIAGAYTGAREIPDYYKNKVEEVNYLNLKEIAGELLQHRK